MKKDIKERIKSMIGELQDIYEQLDAENAGTASSQDQDTAPEGISLFEQDGKTWIRVKIFDEDFLLDTKDMTDEKGNKEFTWQEAMDEAKRQGYELMSRKQGAIVSAYLEEVKKINGQAHGDSLDNPYWTGARFYSTRAWFYSGGLGSSDYRYLFNGFYARLLAYPIKKS